MTTHNLLFPPNPREDRFSILILVGRILLGLSFFSHGYFKVMHYNAMVTEFPNPLGIGSEASMILVIFAELVCSFGFIFGCLFRLSLIPMIFTMMIAFFIVQAGDPFEKKELAFVYLVVFILNYVSGPGKYSIDGIFRSK